MRLTASILIAACFLAGAEASAQSPPTQVASMAPSGSGSYEQLLRLNSELNAYMVPAFTGGVVLESGARVGQDYGDARMAAKLAGLDAFDARLDAMNVAGWPRAQQVDWLAVRSLLNGYRFNLAVLRPWKRDPGFYLDPLMKVAFTEFPPRATSSSGCRPISQRSRQCWSRRAPA